MTGNTFAVFDRQMLYPGCDYLLLNVVMTFVTEFGVGFDKEFLVVRLMRIVTRRAFTILHRQMLYFPTRQLLLCIFMAVEAELAVRFDQ